MWILIQHLEKMIKLQKQDYNIFLIKANMNILFVDLL